MSDQCAPEPRISDMAIPSTYTLAARYAHVVVMMYCDVSTSWRSACGLEILQRSLEKPLIPRCSQTPYIKFQTAKPWNKQTASAMLVAFACEPTP